MPFSPSYLRISPAARTARPVGHLRKKRGFLKGTQTPIAAHNLPRVNKQARDPVIGKRDRLQKTDVPFHVSFSCPSDREKPRRENLVESEEPVFPLHLSVLSQVAIKFAISRNTTRTVHVIQVRAEREALDYEARESLSQIAPSNARERERMGPGKISFLSVADGPWWYLIHARV